MRARRDRRWPAGSLCPRGAGEASCTARRRCAWTNFYHTGAQAGGNYSAALKNFVPTVRVAPNMVARLVASRPSVAHSCGWWALAGLDARAWIAEGPCAAEQRGVAGGDHERRNGRQEAGEAAFGFKALAKWRAGEKRAEPRHNPAADVHPAACAERKGQIASDHAEPAAEHIERAPAGAGHFCQAA